MNSLLTFMRSAVEEQKKLDNQKLSYRIDEKKYLSNLKREVWIYRRNNKKLLTQDLEAKKFDREDFEIIRDFVYIVCGHFFINESYQTIEKDYQEICSFFIALLLERNTLWVINFLKYFDPQSSYYKLVKALTLFRLSKDPVYELPRRQQEVSDLLYSVVQENPGEFLRALSIMKEYIDRVFSVLRSIETRVDFVVGNSSKSWIFWSGTSELSSWLVKFFEEEPIAIYEPTQEEEFSALIEQEKENYKSERDFKDKQLELLRTQLEKLQRENLQLQEYVKREGSQQKNIDGIQQDVHSNSYYIGQLQERRKYYKIMIVWGSDKANKAYSNLRKKKIDFLEQFGLNWSQFELVGSYSDQKDRKFTRKIYDSLLLERTNFVIVLQTDHESPFAKLIEKPEIWNKITVFAEREGKGNPAFVSQKFSQERFSFYLNKALEKYETEQENTRNIIC